MEQQENTEITEEQETVENQEPQEESPEPEESTNVVTVDKDDIPNSESGTIENEKSSILLWIGIGIIAVIIIAVIIVKKKK